MLSLKLTRIFFLGFLLLLINCPNRGNSEWLIPEDEVYEGGPGRDGIPALENPEFVSISGIDYLTNDDFVLGIKTGNEIRAYPHAILDWHEIINDDIGLAFAITYCPLTGSGIGWNRTLHGEKTTFGVSGLLHNSNLIPYDRATESNWSQMMLLCVNGELIRENAETVHIIETTWDTWQALYPGSKVVSKNTGYSRPYGSYPYGDYKTNHDALRFPISNDDPRLPRKERVHGIIIGDKTKVYRISSFTSEISTINDSFEGIPVVAAGSSTRNFVVTYERKLPDGTVLSFEPVEDELPVIMMDNEGTKWNIFGEAADGPRTSTKLTPTKSFNAYWFAWGTFYPNAEIHGQ